MSLRSIKKAISVNWQSIQQNFEPDELEYSSDAEVSGLTDLYVPETKKQVHTRDIADVLTETDCITPEQLDDIRETAGDKEDIAAVLKDSDAVSEDDIVMAQAMLGGHEFKHIDPEQINKDAFEMLTVEYIKTNRVAPISFDDDALVIATSRPDDIFIIDDIKRKTSMTNVRIVVCSDENITEICDSLGSEDWDYCVDDIIQDLSQSDLEVVADKKDDLGDLAKMAGESPVIKFVNYLITNAIKEGASDIHLEPKEDYLKVRYRIDGMLSESMRPPVSMHPAVVSRIKIMSNLDISERRVPQDGRIAVIIAGRKIDLRISTLPTSHGEKVVIRVLDSQSIMLGLEQLGMETDILDCFRSQVTKPNGIVLVTGPTGSGKTTTLYSALNQMNCETLNVSTVEDPVEYHLDFTNQVQINEKAGLTFSTALRSLLRQDPDVIMIGEIRDMETAKIAVQAALTGHLVLSTLHTNDAPSSISRLVDIGVEPYLIAASLNSILAQRLVRKICPDCKKPLEGGDFDRMREIMDQNSLGSDQLMTGGGCDKCRNTGYIGRLGIYEILEVENTFREAIANDASVNSMRRIFAESDQRSLYQDGLRKIAKGLTTLDEVLRVTESH